MSSDLASVRRVAGQGQAQMTRPHERCHLVRWQSRGPELPTIWRQHPRHELALTAPNQKSGRPVRRFGADRACHGSGCGLDYRWLGEKPGRAASCSAKRQMLRGMAKVSISLWS